MWKSYGLPSLIQERALRFFSPIRIYLLRFIPCLIVFAGLTTVSDSKCDAQLFRFKRRFHAGPSIHQGTQEVSPTNHADHEVNRFAPGPAKWNEVLGYDPRIHLDADRYSRYPKFIGGFHSSHFTDVGLPPGDKGFRGNGLYWAPW